VPPNSSPADGKTSSPCQALPPPQLMISVCRLSDSGHVRTTIHQGLAHLQSKVSVQCASPVIHNEVTAIPWYEARREGAHALIITDSYIEYDGVQSAVSFQPWACPYASGKGPVDIMAHCLWCAFMFQATRRIEGKPSSPLCTAVEALSNTLPKLRQLDVTFSCARTASPWCASSWAQWQDQMKAIIRSGWLHNLFAPSVFLPSHAYNYHVMVISEKALWIFSLEINIHRMRMIAPSL